MFNLIEAGVVCENYGNVALSNMRKKNIGTNFKNFHLQGETLKTIRRFEAPV